MADFMYRATDKATWDAYADAMCLTSDAAIIDEIGPIVATPAVIGEDGEIITPAVMDDRWHVNVRVIREPTFEEGEETVTITMEQLAAGGEDVEWVDPSLVSNPRRIFAGGMNYWTPLTEQVQTNG